MNVDNLKIVALVPMRHTSERVPGKNYRGFAGKPLFHRIVGELEKCPIVNEIAVDTDSPFIRAEVEANFPQVKLIDRPEHLCGGTVPMNDVLLHDVGLIEADYYLQTHSTNPLLRAETITNAIEKFLSHIPMYDTMFTVTRLNVRLWDALSRAINHNPRILLRTQDLPPIYEENSCLYLFSKEVLEKYGNRIGQKPLMFAIDRQEALDIDEELDFKIAEFLYQQVHPNP